MSDRTLSIALVGEPTGWHVGRVGDAALRRGHRQACVRWEELSTAVGGGGRELFLPEAISEADAILVRSMPAGGLEEVIFRMNVLARLTASGRLVVNAPRSLELAIDKHLSLAVLAAAGIHVPRSQVAQAPEAIRAAWHDLGGDAVTKPIFGSRGKGIERIDTPASLERFIASRQPGTVAYLQEFVPHGRWDARILSIGDRLFAMRRVSDGDWRTNVALGARAEPFDAPPHWFDLAARATRLLGLDMAGVDLLEGPDGDPVIVEVNAVPGWRAMEAVVGENLADIAVRHLESLARPGPGLPVPPSAGKPPGSS